MKDKKAVRNIGRADFIKKAAMATAGFYIVPRFVLGGTGYTAPSDKLYSSLCKGPEKKCGDRLSL